MSFTKLHGTILDSSIWSEGHTTRILWITMLAMADENGVVEASVCGLARRAVITMQECVDGLYVLSGPDPDSRDGTTGERIEKVPGGWFVINHSEYRDKRTSAQIATALRVRRHRAKLSTVTVTVGNDVTNVMPRNDFPPPEAEAEAEAEAEKPPCPPSAARPSESVAAVGRELVSAWNAVPGFTPCRTLTDKRLAQLRARAGNVDWLASWQPALKHAATISGLKGTNERTWRATIEWFLKPDTVIKILEGQYDTWGKNGTTSKAETADDVLARHAQLQAKRAAEDAAAFSPNGQHSTEPPA